MKEGHPFSTRTAIAIIIILCLLNLGATVYIIEASKQPPITQEDITIAAAQGCYEGCKSALIDTVCKDRCDELYDWKQYIKDEKTTQGHTVNMRSV